MEDAWTASVLEHLALSLSPSLLSLDPLRCPVTQQHTINDCRVDVTLYSLSHSSDIYKLAVGDSNEDESLLSNPWKAEHLPPLRDYETSETEKVEHSYEAKWKNSWKILAENLKISLAVMQKGLVASTAFHPLRIHPHIIPYLAIILSDTSVAVVTKSIDNDWIPMQTCLRFHHSHIDYDSQAQSFLAVQLSELYSQMRSLSLNQEISISSMYCDNALWILYDPIREACIVDNDSERASLDSYTNRWVKREIGNYDYLMKLNEYAGRQRGEVHNHPIFPWVCDFTSKDGGWRKMNRTKYRMNKGDDQLREMFSRSPAHHVPELLSDIGYMVYRARIETKQNLCNHVRSKWVPLEYPVSMARMYEWTPDECIPEFYDTPEILVSTHPDMPSLELPPFTSSPQEFIDWHRKMLDSDVISVELPKWIDLTFGYLLQGEPSVHALNVHLSLVEKPDRRLRRHGVVQLFDVPHPNRVSGEDDALYSQSLLEHEYKESGSKDDSDKEDEDEDLSTIYRRLRKECKSEHGSSLKEGIINCLCAIAMAPKSLARMDRKGILERLRTHSYILPSSLRRILYRHLIEEQPLPPSSIFPLYLITALNIPFDMVDAHDQLASFYSFHLLLHSPPVRNNEKREQSLLIRELSSLRLFIHSAISSLEFVVVALFERLLKNPVEAITAVHRLVSLLCRTLSDSSLRQLIQPLTALLACESSIKLLDRRFLLPVSTVYGAPLFLCHFVAPLVEAAASRQTDRSIVAKNSLLWLSKRYGPVVCSRFITSDLLRILSSCYHELRLMGKNQEPQCVFSLPLEGDEWGCRVESALAEIAASYSVTFVTVQYLPFCVDLVEQCFRRMTSSAEACLVSAFRIAHLSVKAMNDHQLMNYLEDYIIDKLLVRVIETTLLSSTSFSSERNRIVVLARAIQLLFSVSTRVGAENARLYARKPFHLLFEAFSSQYGADEELKITKKERREDDPTCPLPLWLVSSTIDGFVSEWGVPLLSSLCPDPAFLVPFVSSKACGPSSLGAPSSPSLPPLSFSIGCFPAGGNRLFSLSSSTPSPSPTAIGGVGTCDSDSLSAVWCARVSAATSIGRPSYRFDHLSLCSFEGHSGAIRCSAALSNENSFISGSADRTVKLWSMRPEHDCVEAQWTYRSHSRSINDVISLDSNAIASTDGAIHVWDPFRGSLVAQLEWTEGNVIGLAKVDRTTLAAISSLHPTIRLFDSRSSDWSCELNVSTSPGLTRALAVSENGFKIAVALSSGTVVQMDSRTGKLCSLSHGNNTHPTAIRWLSPSEILVCDSDEPAVVFSAQPRSSPLRRLHDSVVSSSVTSVAMTSSDIETPVLLSTIQNHGILRLYSGGDLVLESSLRTESLPGSASSLVHLPLNNAFLIGTSNGTLKLMC